MKFQKQPTSVNEQAKLLVSRGMEVPDLAKAEQYLAAIGYYRLSAYWLPMEEPSSSGETRSKRFKPGTKFEDVLKIYIFDRKLRLLMMEATERVEIFVRSNWTNALTLAHGSHAYMDARNFISGADHLRYLSKLSENVKRSKETSIAHYNGKYTDPFLPPLWAASELMTIGELSQWLTMTRDNKIRDAVAKKLSFPTKESFEGSLQVFALIRNIAAHHGRLWNRKLIKRIPRIKRWDKEMAFETQKLDQWQPENTIYNPIVAILHAIRMQNPASTFPKRLRALVDKLNDKQRSEMGFPDDWRSRATWIGTP